MSRPLVILGTGGGALDVLDIVAALEGQAPGWDVVGYVDDTLRAGVRHEGLPVYGGLADAGRLAAPGGALAAAAFINAIGSERTHGERCNILARTGLPPRRFATLVHPAASVPPSVTLGHGCCIGFGVSVGGRVRLADHVWLGPGCIVGHDSVMEAAALVAPGAVVSGHVQLGANCYVGSRAVLRQGVRIGQAALVGMGAVVLRDVPEGVTVVGNPARRLR